MQYLKATVSKDFDVDTQRRGYCFPTPPPPPLLSLNYFQSTHLRNFISHLLRIQEQRAKLATTRFTGASNNLTHLLASHPRLVFFSLLPICRPRNLVHRFEHTASAAHASSHGAFTFAELTCCGGLVRRKNVEVGRNLGALLPGGFPICTSELFADK